MDPLDDIWARLAGLAGVVDHRPDFRFDARFYARTYPDLTGSRDDLLRHFTDHGRAEGRHPTAHARLRAEAPQIDATLAPLVRDPQLRALVDAGHPGACELAFELIQLGAPVDARMSDFSKQAYLDWHPDILAAGMDPLGHYLRYGAIERGRRTLADLRRNTHPGGRAFRPDRPCMLIGMEQLAGGDVAAVGGALVRQAARTHNVALAGLRGGALLDSLLPDCCAALITAQPLRDLPYVDDPAFARIDHAILNGTGSMLFVHPLVARGTPFAAYVHEHADLVHPAHVQTLASFADLLVFASDHLRDSWAGRLADLAFDMAHDSTVIAPAPLTLGEVTEDRRRAARQRLSQVLGRDLSGQRLICGAGDLGWHGGCDLFVQAARLGAAVDPEALFIWAGDGRNHQDRGFGIWFEQQLRHAGAGTPDGNLVLLPQGPLTAQLLDAADAMFLSARLDPVPAVVFDAVARGVRVVCFDDATGLADARYRRADRITVVPHGDPTAALRALLALPRKVGTPGPMAAPPDPGPAACDRIRIALQDRLARQRNFVLGDSAIDIPLLFTASDSDRPLRRAEREKLMRYGRRRLWRDVDEARATIAASDNWIHRRLRIEDYRPLPPDAAAIPDFAVHLHAFYLDDLQAALRDHAAFARARRIVITTDSRDKADLIDRMGADLGLPVQTQVVANRGRDILPFLQLFAPGGLAGQDLVWCHLHQKKSVQTTSHGDVWRRFLHRILLGDRDSLSPALMRIAQPGIGLVAPFEPHFVPWDDSRRHLPALAGRFSGPLPDNPLLFPVGNMFWTRADMARRMLDLFGPDHPWPNEPIPTDGTEFHLIERLWPAMAAQMGLDAVFLHKPDEPRV